MGTLFLDLSSGRPFSKVESPRRTVISRDTNETRNAPSTCVDKFVVKSTS